MKRFALLPVAAIVLGAGLMMSSSSQAAPAIGQALKVEAGHGVVEQTRYRGRVRCHRKCVWRFGHRHCRRVCR